MRLGAGPGKTRDDHLEIAAQLYAFTARARQVADLADVVGADALAPGEARFLDFAAAFRRAFLAQGRRETRSLDETLDRAWRVASALPSRELTMVSGAALEAHYRQPAVEEGVEDASPDASRQSG
jgi:V/A-type H+-transporting ATPase subunit B